jgi:hypothetical protein
MRVAQQVMQDPERIAAERASIVPPFAEAEFQVPDRRALDRDLSVMPRRTWPIHRRHRLALPVAVMAGIVSPAVAKVDTANEGNVVIGSACSADDDEFLVVGAAEPHTLVEQDLTPG